MRQLNGYLAAPYTPMFSNGDVNLDLIPEYADFLMRNGLDGVFVCGSTGEGALLTREERMAVAEKWLEACGMKMKIIVQTGGCNLRDQQILAAHAEKMGAWGVAAMAPAFLPPKRNEELLALCLAVAGAAPSLPFYYYHIPSLTGVQLPVNDLLKAADGVIPNIAGAKYTSSDIVDYEMCRRVSGGKFEMLWGMDEMFLEGLERGVTSGVGGTYNHCFCIYKQMREAYASGKVQECLKLKLNSGSLFRVLEKYRGNIIAGKGIMKFLGLDCGPNRLPLQSLSEEEGKQMHSDLDEIGFFSFCNG